MNYLYLKEFWKDFKKLEKKFKTLSDDFKVFKNSSLELFHGSGIEQDIKRITGTGQDTISIFKARRFACKSLKGKGARSGIRLIYAHYQETNTIEFIEIYYKGNKINEKQARIKKYLKKGNKLRNI